MNRQKRNRRRALVARNGCALAVEIRCPDVAHLLAAQYREKIETAHKWARVDDPSIARVLRSGAKPF